MKGKDTSAYAAAGVQTALERGPMAAFLKLVRATYEYTGDLGRPVLDVGYFANVIRVAPNLGIAISADGVGTKILVAEMMEKYDTVGIDLVAMNANDIVCVGAEPISMVDYIALQEVDEALLTPLGEGLRRGAELAGINIPGGEVAQVREMLKGAREGGNAFDLVGTCLGVVALDRINVGAAVRPGDALVGLASSGIHSNGLSLARRVFFEREGVGPDHYYEELGRSIGEELLEPTVIYVKPVLEMLKSGVDLHAMVHITGDGLLNLPRVTAPVGFVVENPPEPPPVFGLIQRLGGVRLGEMYRVFNMGVGFCLLAPEGEVDRIGAIAAKYGIAARRLGQAVDDSEKRVRVPSLGLVSEGGELVAE